MNSYLEFDEGGISSKGVKFNEKFDTRHLNNVSEDDESIKAEVIRTMTAGVSSFITPRQLITILFVIAAYTIVILGLTIISDLVFIYVECFSGVSKDVGMKLGSFHDMKLRLFGICFAIIATMVELDVDFLVQRVTVLKSFIPRSIFLFFVATLSETNPMILYDGVKQSSSNYDDDDYFSLYSNYTSSSSMYQNSYGFIQDEISSGVIRLQSVSSVLLKISALAYLVSGIMCLDQFLPAAFVDASDPEKDTEK